MASEAKKIAYFLPNTFTALNMACGFGCIMLAVKGNYYAACMVLLLGAVFDSVDGRIARLTGTQSPFGEQFDSLSDVVSFGVAPAFLVYYSSLFSLGRVGIVVAFLYLLCGALRLARFNANIDKVDCGFFQGLPIPGAALALAGYTLLSLELPVLKEYSIIAAAYVTLYSLLMISNISFCSFKNSMFVRKHKKLVLITIFMIFILVFIYEQFMIFAVITVYVLASLIYFFAKHGRLQEVFLWKNDKENDED